VVNTDADSTGRNGASKTRADAAVPLTAVAALAAVTHFLVPDVRHRLAFRSRQSEPAAKGE
jgi:hypothetical protein